MSCCSCVTGASSSARRECASSASRATRRGRTSRGSRRSTSTCRCCPTEGFGLAREFIGFQGIPERSAFLIDADGVARGVWRYDDSEVPDFDELLRAAGEL